jgi:hypothetical protein
VGTSKAIARINEFFIGNPFKVELEIRFPKKMTAQPPGVDVDQ